MTPEFMLCDCNSPDHQIIIHKDDGEGWPEVYLHIHLVNRSFWRRLKYAVKYVFGYKSRFGAWDEFLFTTEHRPVLERLIEYIDTIPECMNLEGPKDEKQ